MRSCNREGDLWRSCGNAVSRYTTAYAVYYRLVLHPVWVVTLRLIYVELNGVIPVFYIDSAINLLRVYTILQFAHFIVQLVICHVTSQFQTTLVRFVLRYSPQWTTIYASCVCRLQLGSCQLINGCQSNAPYLNQFLFGVYLFPSGVRYLAVI